MNKLIKELALQAGLPLIHDKFMTASQEKFAELIVRECARVAKITEPYNNKEYVLGRKWAGFDVLDYFGVEE